MSSERVEDRYEPVDIDQELQWEDATVYEWTISSSKDDFGGMIAYFIGAAIGGPAIIYFALWLLSKVIGLTASYWIGLVATGLFFLFLLVQIGITWRGKKHEQIQARSDLLYMAIATLGGLFYVLNSPASHFTNGFHNGNAGLWQWLLFFVDNTASVIFLDIPELFEINSSVVRVNDWVSRTLTVIIRLLITVGLIKLILELYRTRYSKTVIYCTVPELYWHCKALPDTDDMVVQKTGRAISLEGQVRFAVNDVLKHYASVAEQESNEES